jgi:16S rRNA (guanine527-N7)-methyltransferase
MAEVLETRLVAGAKALGIALEPRQTAAFMTLIAELAEWNTRFNLTAITVPADIVDKHLLDSLAVQPYLYGLRIADIGTGAGFPGLPLSIVNPNRRFTLVESTGKKAAFLRHVIDGMKLPNVEVVEGRSEAMHPSKPFDSVIARALGSLAEFLRVAGHLAGRNGRLLAMKGRAPMEELERLPAGWKALGVHPLRVPGLDAERCLVELARV